ncbi:MAG: TolC family protein [Cyclobacteriaceae bacterium]
MNVRLITTLTFIMPILLMAQESPKAQKFGLEDCIAYALENATSAKNARLEERSAESKVKETVGIGLPQISGNLSAQRSPELSRYYAQYFPTPPGEEPSGFGPSDAEAQALGMQAGDVFAAQNFFQLKSSGDASLSIDQLIFSGSYIVGLQASNAYKDLAIKQKVKTEGDIKSDVAKAYFNVLINQDRERLFTANIARLDTLYRNTIELNKNGFAEQIDVDRLKVSLNNMKSEEQNIKNLNILSMRLLKFQMGYPLSEPMELAGTIDDVLSAPLGEISTDVTYANRPDYQVLMANKDLQELNLKNKYAEALPTIGAFANLGYNTQSPSFSGLFKTESSFSEQQGVGPDQWYNYSTLGVRLSWKIFTGTQRTFQIQQQKIELEKIENNINQFEQMIHVEVQEAALTLENALQRFEVQKENTALAENIFRITQLKYEQGVGSNLEVIEADSALKEAQTNYYNSLFAAIIAKIDLSMALGEN